MKLVWARPAHIDRQEIREHVAQHAPAAALALDELFSKKANLLVHHPGLGRPGRIVHTRELVVHQNYILVYDVAGDFVRVLRVLHAAREWPPSGKSSTISEMLAATDYSPPQPAQEREKSFLFTKPKTYQL